MIHTNLESVLVETLKGLCPDTSKLGNYAIPNKMGTIGESHRGSNIMLAIERYYSTETDFDSLCTNLTKAAEEVHQMGNFQDQFAKHRQLFTRLVFIQKYLSVPTVSQPQVHSMRKDQGYKSDSENKEKKPGGKQSRQN